jgi:hypothetical protein
VIGWTVMATASSWGSSDPVLDRNWTTERPGLQMLRRPEFRYTAA